MPQLTPLALCAILSAGAAAPATAAPAPRRMDLAGLLERVRAQPVVEAARATAREAQAKVREVSRSWLPTLEVTATGGPSQELKCSPGPDNCERTNSSETTLGFAGIFGRADGKLTMPIFTFGKIAAGTRAAEAGARAQEALAEGAEQGAVVDAGKAYFAVKLGRELLAMLEEGRGHVDDEIKREEPLLESGSGEVTEADHRRLLTLRAEIDARTSEARHVEELGLAGVHYVLGNDGPDVDEAPLFPIDFDLPTRAQARELARRRPEQRASTAGAEAAAHLEDLERARWWPDLVLVAEGTLASSTSVDHPHNAFLNDPYNSFGGAGGLVLRWAPEPFARGPRIDQAEAAQDRARATEDMAREGLAAEAERAWADARDARDRMKAAREGQHQAKAWLAAVMQSEAAGLVEPKDLADSLLQYFMMRARLTQAMFDWNVGVLALQRATGQGPGAIHFLEGGD